MKNILILIMVMALISCHDDNEQVNQKKQYTFNVYAPDRSSFQAEISWGLNSIQYVDKVNSSLYASGFEYAASDKFIIQVNSILGNVVLEISENSSGQKKLIHIKTGQLHEFSF